MATPPIFQLPAPVLQSQVLQLFGSRELFRLRGVSSAFCDATKTVWCQVVKTEMLEQVQSLDLLYEKETTGRLLEFKLKYLDSYAELMRNYFVHMNFQDIVTELRGLNDLRARQLLLICANVVGPNEITYPTTVEAMSPEEYDFAEEFVQSDVFKQKFNQICQMGSMPDVTLAQLKVIKSGLMDGLITPTLAEELGNAGRLVCSWLDGILEFTILKHEVIVLRIKNNKVLDQIRNISQLWPRRKEFIEGAYKILLFTKMQRRQVSHCFSHLREALPDFMDFKLACNRVIRVWYERRILEETEKNQKLKELHQELLQKKLEIHQQQMLATREDQSLVSGGQCLQVEGSSETRQESTEENLQKQQELLTEISSLKNQITDKHAEIEETKTQIVATQRKVDQVQAENRTLAQQLAPSEESQPLEQPIMSVAGAVQQSELLRQILMVGSLFNARVFQADDHQQPTQQVKGNPFHDSEDSEEQPVSVEQRRANLFEKCLKQRIFLSDRMEKIEKALIGMDMIHKEICFCSPGNLAEFQRQFVGAQPEFKKLILEDVEDVWFEIYRSVASDKQQVEAQIERQLQNRQRRDQRRLIKKRRRLESIKAAFVERANQLSQIPYEQRKQYLRHHSAPPNPNMYRDETKIMREQEKLQQMATETREHAMGAINELGSVVMNLVATRYLLDVVQGAQQEGQVDEQLLNVVSNALNQVQSNQEEIQENSNQRQFAVARIQQEEQALRLQNQAPFIQQEHVAANQQDMSMQTEPVLVDNQENAEQQTDSETNADNQRQQE